MKIFAFEWYTFIFSFYQGLHPVQEKIYLGHGSQCGFCTPGMVMSFSSELRNCTQKGCLMDVEDMEKSLQGNLCRCTGYRSILESFDKFCKGNEAAEENCSMAKESDSKIPIEIMNGELNEEFLHFVDCRVNFENNLRPC